MRLFVAIPFPEIAAGYFSGLRDLLKETIPELKWVEPRNLHMTLKFLGSVEDERLVAVREALKNGLSGMRRFTVELKGVGAFPAPQRPGVLWVGVADGAAAVTRLAAAVEESLAGAGFSREDRTFHPHITLARARRIRSLPGPPWPEPWGEMRFDVYPVRNVVLMQSHLKPSGSLYESLAVYPLEGD